MICPVRILAAALLVAGPVAADTLTPFHTPSGNIHCMGLASEGGALVDCEVIEMTSGPAAPALRL